jgi:NADPH:quinone reductase-like Zn-dependent oxidoreductase
MKGQDMLSNGAATRRTMKAIVLTRYGDPTEVLEYADTEKPSVGDDDVLVRVQAAGVDPGVWHLVRGEAYIARLAFGLRRPKARVPGKDVAGTVEAVGRNVQRFTPGDEVFGELDDAFAEFAAAHQDLLWHKPPNLTADQAAAAPISATAALQGLRDSGGLRPGQHVLINGAAGGVGTFAVQIAKSLGAEVTGVCSTRNVELVRSLGADHVVDYTRDDFARSGRQYDVIFDLIGNRSLSDCRRALTPRGTLVLSAGGGGRWLGPMGRILRAVVLSMFIGQRLRTFMATRKQEDLGMIAELLESGHVTPVIDRTYPLSETPEAIHYVEQGHARGKVVVTA